MSHPLATNDQRELEALALRIAAAPSVRAAREKARALLLANPTAHTRDGAAGLDRALDQWVMGGVVAVVNNDPSRPRALWARAFESADLPAPGTKLPKDANDEPVDAGTAIGIVGPGFVCGGRNIGLLPERAEIGKG